MTDASAVGDEDAGSGVTGWPSGFAGRLRTPPLPTRRSLPSRPGWLRLFALAAWLTLTWSYVGVLYHVTDVAGGVRWLALGVGLALVAGTAVARLLSARAVVGLGVVALAVGLAAYVYAVPGLATALTNGSYLSDVWTTLTGASVLGFVRVDLWAVVVAPAPVFVSWHMALRRRYDWSVLAGGVALGFFVLSGDAGETATLVGVVGALCLLAVGGMERAGVTADQLERLGLGLAFVVVAARLLSVVPTSRAAAAGATAGGRGDAPGAGLSDAIEDDRLDGLTRAGDRLGLAGRISLSPAVQFTVTAAEPALWHVAAYDRYTGDGWVSTGGSAPYAGQLSGPPGPTRRLDQRVEAAVDLGVMPAAWRPVAVGEAAADETVVVSSGDLRPAEALAAGESFEVESYVPTADPGRLRRAGTDYPPAVADRFLELPGSTPDRVADLAAQVAGDAESPYDAATAIRAWLRRSKGYSLDARNPSDRTADGFLFGMDRGYCVHFATAMAVLLRTLDVPARVAAGYRPGQRVADDRWVVRGLDSHAWVEIFFPGVGWMPFDPTPPDPRRAAEEARLASARRNGEAGVDTGDTTPTTTGGRVGETSDRDPIPGRADPDLPSLDRDAVRSPGGRATGPAALLTPLSDLDAVAGRDRVTLLAAAAGALVGARRLRLLARGHEALWLRSQEPSDDPATDVELAFARLEALAARDHRRRDEAETPRQYLDAVGTGDDARARLVLAHLERARYAGDVTRADADEAIAVVDRLVHERRRTPGRLEPTGTPETDAGGDSG